MVFSARNRSGGFTYLAALVMVIIMGIMLGAIGQTWSTVMKREREEELLFRGKQIVDAIARYNKATTRMRQSGGPPVMPLKDLSDLLKFPGSLATVRYLRRDPKKEYNDPITGKEWKVITDPILGVVGVVSTSDETPLRQSKIGDMFLIRPDETYLTTMFGTFEGKTKYSEWQFVYGLAPQAVSTQDWRNSTIR